ncbi:carnosine N-methyltransferase 2-like [Glandiceps talaboti]
MEGKILNVHDEGLGFYEEHSTDISSTNQWTQQQFPSLLNYWKASQSISNTFEVLAIGSGRGEKDVEILQRLGDTFDKICYRVVEPSIDRMNDFQSKVSNKKFSGQVDFDWRHQLASFDSVSDKKFHLIHLLHVLAYIEDSENFILQCYKQLHSDGILLVQMDSDQNNGLAFLNDTSLGDSLTGDGVMNGFLTGDQLENVLRKYGMNYQVFHYSGNADITECFIKGSSKGERLLDFLLLQENFDISKLTSNIRLNILDFLKNSNHVISNDNRFAIQDDFDMFLIYKSDRL